jgi:hypothetical protein
MEYIEKLENTVKYGNDTEIRDGIHNFRIHIDGPVHKAPKQ